MLYSGNLELIISISIVGTTKLRINDDLSVKLTHCWVRRPRNIEEELNYPKDQDSLILSSDFSKKKSISIIKF